MDENANIYGIGERVDSFRLDTNNRNYEMFNRGSSSLLIILIIIIICF